MNDPRRGALALLALLGVALLVIGARLALQAPRASAADVGVAPSAAARPADTASAPEVPPAPAPEAGPEPAPVLPVPPAEVTLTAQQVSAPVVAVGVLDSGQLQLPDDPGTVGWWAGGALPGAPTGTVVLAGHLDSVTYGPGPLEALLETEAGDLVELRDDEGTAQRYRVVARRSYGKADLPADLFAVDGPPGLVLITCGGEFDERRGRYADNVVVYASPA